MLSGIKRKSKRKTAWQRFLDKYADRVKKLVDMTKFQEMYSEFSQELNEERKQELKFAYLKEVAPSFTLAFFEELASTSEREFNRMMSEVGKAMEEKLEELGRDYLNFELMMRDPIIVLQEAFLTERVGRAVQKELEKQAELFEDPRLLLRLIALMTIRELSFGVIFATLSPLFEVLNMARKRLEIDENWAIATFALNLEESLVKKKLSELDVSTDEMKEPFHKLVEKTISLIEMKEERRLSSEVFLLSGYRKLRNKLYHEGYLWKPTRKETNEIVRHLLRLEKTLWKE